MRRKKKRSTKVEGRSIIVIASVLNFSTDDLEISSSFVELAQETLWYLFPLSLLRSRAFLICSIAISKERKASKQNTQKKPHKKRTWRCRTSKTSSGKSPRVGGGIAASAASAARRA